MYSHDSEVTSSRFSQDDRAGIQLPPPQSRLALPGFYTDLMQKYPRAFELQLRAEQQRSLANGGHPSFDPGPVAAPARQNGWTRAAIGSTSREELSQIIAMLASSLAHREGSGPLHDKAFYSDTALLREQAAEVNTVRSARLASSPNSLATGGNSDLRARLQRNKEVMQKLLGDRSPFMPPGPAAAERHHDPTAQGTVPSHEVAVTRATFYDGHNTYATRIASPSTRRLPRTRLVSVDATVGGAVIAEDPVNATGGSEHRSTKHSIGVPHDGYRADTAVLGSVLLLEEPVSCTPTQAGLQQPLHVQQHIEDVTSYQLRSTLGFDERASTSSLSKSLQKSDCANGFVAATECDLDSLPKGTNSTHPAPKVKKSNSAKVHRSNPSSESNLAGVEVGFHSSAAAKKRHSILRSAESFGGSTGKAGRVRFIETPDTIDETEPRLAELKWLSESLVFDSDLLEGGENGTVIMPGSGGRRRRARQPAVARSLADVQAPPKPARLHLSSERDDIKLMANGTENDESGRHAKGLPADAAAVSDAIGHAFNHNVLRDPERRPVGDVSGSSAARLPGMQVAGSELGNMPDHYADSYLAERRPAVPKVKSSRRTKLAASDFELPYTSAANDTAVQLVKSRFVGEASPQPVQQAKNADKPEGTLAASVQPANDLLYNTTRSEPIVTSLDALPPQHALPGRSRSRKPDATGRGKSSVDIPGSIADSVGETPDDHDICVADEELPSENLEKAAGIAADEHDVRPNTKPAIPIYDIDDHADTTVGDPAEATVGTTSSNKSTRLSRFDVKPIHGSLSGSQQSLSERMGSLRRAARGAIKTLRRAMSLERLSPGSRGSMRSSDSHDGRGDDLPATEAELPPTTPVLVNAKPVPTAAPPGDVMPKVKKSLSLRSLGKLSFKKRASYDLNAGSGPQPAAFSKNGSSSALLRTSAGSNAIALYWQQAPTAPSSLDTSVDHPKNFRAIGKLLELHPDGTRTVQLQRPPHGPFGFYVSRGGIGAATTAALQASASGSAVFITRLSDSYPEKLFAGLLAIGDELLEVNRRPVSQLSLDDIHDIMATTTDALLLLVKPALIQAAG